MVGALKPERNRTMKPTMTIEQITTEARAIADAIEARKARAMIYQADAKDRFAAALGLNATDLYLMPYEDWSALCRAHPELVR